MSRMQRSPLTATEETEFWVRWKRGELLPAIGRALGRQRSTLAGYMAGHGGIPPPKRRRATRRSRHATIRGQGRGSMVAVETRPT